MFDLVDIHSHTLSRVDDGAHDSTMMKNMLDIAYKDNIKTICFSPHFKTYEFRNNEEISSYRKGITRSFNLALEYVNSKYPDMKLYLGNEIMYHNEIFDSLSAGFCTTINQGSYVLVEFSPNASAYDINGSVMRILRKGFIPIIAHVERYASLACDISLIKELRQNGALIQVNAKSINGFFLSKSTRFIHSLLKKRLVDVIASDAHDDKHFAPILSKALASVTKKFGEGYARKIFRDNPIAIINNKKTL